MVTFLPSTRCVENSLIKSAHSPELGMHYSEQEDVPWWAEWYFLKLGKKLHPLCPDVKDRLIWSLLYDQFYLFLLVMVT